VIVDSSAIVAILLKEPGYERLRDRLAAAQEVRIAAPTATESSLVLSARLGLAGKTLLARFLQEAEIEVVELTADHWTVAADAFIAYGKGRHRAALNFGDCLTYAIIQACG
jgi:ribonuclease VapC